MNPQKLLDEILPILYTMKENEVKLQKIRDFLINEIYEEPEELIRTDTKCNFKSVQNQ